MPEPVEPTNDFNEELSRLRTANRELVEKKNGLKLRVTELETESAGLKNRAEAAEAKLRDRLINVPLRKMADSIATIPELFQEQLLKHYKVELNDKDALELRNLDGKPVLDKDNKAVPFEADSLKKLLYDDQPADSYLRKVMGSLLIGSRASGGGATGSGSRPGPQSPDKQKKPHAEPTLQLGLR